jgi:hypothetical protein
MSNGYKKEWIAQLLKENFPGWLVADDGKHIFIKIPDDQDLDVVYAQFPDVILSIKPKIKSKPVPLTFFIGNSKDSKFFEMK